MRRLLLPFDFSPHSRRALALALAGVPFGPEVQIDVLHVIDDRLYNDTIPGGGIPSDVALQAYFRAELQRATTPERRLTEAPVLKIVRGRPASEILARVGDYGGIIIGGQGHGGLAEKLLGTTAMRVVREAPVSVYVTKRVESLAVPSRVLCAVDLDESSSRALWAAKALCLQCDATLSVTRSIPLQPMYLEYPGMPPHPDTATVNRERERLITFEIETLRGTFAKYHDVHFSPGGVAYDIAQRAGVDRTDTLVVGARQSSLGKTLLGSVSEGVVQRAPCDVYVVR